MTRRAPLDMLRSVDPWPFLFIGVALMPNQMLGVIQVPVIKLGLTPATIAFGLAIIVFFARRLWLHDKSITLPPRSVGLLLTALWVLLAFPSVLLSLEPVVSLRITAWIPFYAFVGVVAASYIWTRGLEGARRILLVAWYASVGYSVWGLVVFEAYAFGLDLGQYAAGNIVRVTSLTGEAVAFGTYLSLTIPIGLVLASERGSSTLLKVTVPVVLAAALLTFSRGAWVAVAGTMIAFIVVGRFRLRTMLQLLASVVAAALISLAFFGQMPSLKLFLAERIDTAISMALTGEGSRAAAIEAGLRALSGKSPAPTTSPTSSPTAVPPASSPSPTPVVPASVPPATLTPATLTPATLTPPNSVGNAVDEAVSALGNSSPLKLLFGIGQGAPVEDVAALGLGDHADRRQRGQLLFLHSLYAEVFVSSGLLAFIVFLALLVYELWASGKLIFRLPRSERALVSAGFLSLVGILLMGLSFGALISPYVFLALFWNRAIREVQARRVDSPVPAH